ncbi:MAG: MBL fold metallo-hydrolase [Fibrobacteria bacterium]|nr:MBL fold metallo-hydrolase [Fibrobacteria bacterium]
MFIKQFKTGGDRNFGYLATDDESKKAIVIDPSYSPGMITSFAKENNFVIQYAFCTHDHYDHTNGNREFFTTTGIPPLLFGQKEPSSGVTIQDNTSIPLGKSNLIILHTPGHTSDSICIVLGDAVFTGDTLFVGKVGGTDFGRQAEIEYLSLHEKLLTLPDNTRVFPGHDYGIAPTSTIGNEKETNPFLLQPNLESFIDLKTNWLQYKQQYGIP